MQNLLRNSEFILRGEQLTPNVIRILISPIEAENPKEKDLVQPTPAITEEFRGGAPVTEWSISGTPEDFSITGPTGTSYNFTDLLNSEPNKDELSGENSRPISVSQKVNKESLIYGLGETTQRLEKSFSSFELWNTDPRGEYTDNEDPLYVAIPFYILQTPLKDGDKTHNVGIYFDHPSRTKFDIRTRDNANTIKVTVQSFHLSFYIIDGSTAKEIINHYTRLTGRPFMPPKWALGYHHSRWGKPKNQEEAVKLAKTFRQKNIPCDSFHFDIQHLDSFKVFSWDPENFPRPTKLVKDLHKMGFRLVPIVDPGIKQETGYHTYETGRDNNYFLKEHNGEDFTGVLWAGYCSYPDFSRKEVRSWWANQHRSYFSTGVDGIWNDMNEPSIFCGKEDIRKKASEIVDRVETYKNPEEIISSIRKPGIPGGIKQIDNNGNLINHEKFHNLYGFQEAMATKEAFTNLASEKRPFILTRSGFAGIQRHSAIWTGDNSSTWEHMSLSIPMLLNLGLSGVPFVGADVGGFAGNTEPELLTRWYQLGAFYPLFRNHSRIHSRNQHPWSFGQRYEEIIRKFIRLRYSLLPYFYTEFFQSSQIGLPVMRPLFLEFPEDNKTYRIENQFMVGRSLLICPVLEKGADKRLVYLPFSGNGNSVRWEDWETGETYPSGYHIVDTPIHKMPVFIRENSGVPTTGPTPHTGKDNTKLSLRVNLTDKATIPVYDDDKETNEFLDGAYYLGNFQIERSDNSALVKLIPDHEEYSPFWDRVRLVSKTKEDEIKSITYSDNV